MVPVPLGHGIEELWDAVRDRVEVSGHDPTWEVTAGSFDTALSYARARFHEPTVLDRRDRGRWWPRVTLVVTTSPGLAAGAPPLEDLAEPVVPAQRDGAAEDRGTAQRDGAAERDGAEEKPRRAKHRGDEPMTALEEIFAHQDEKRRTRASGQGEAGG